MFFHVARTNPCDTRGFCTILWSPVKNQANRKLTRHGELSCSFLVAFASLITLFFCIEFWVNWTKAQCGLALHGPTNSL
jgi:hypothetical protein